jgi:dynein heavy chain
MPLCFLWRLQMLLDDQVVKTQAMRASPFIKPLEAAALSWEKLLLAAQVPLGPSQP